MQSQIARDTGSRNFMFVNCELINGWAEETSYWDVLKIAEGTGMT